VVVPFLPQNDHRNQRRGDSPSRKDGSPSPLPPREERAGERRAVLSFQPIFSQLQRVGRGIRFLSD
jgi:hypothetical protein